MIELEWDEKKNQINVEKHSISFVIAAHFLQSGHYQEIPSNRHDEERVMAIGLYAGSIITVVFTRRNATIRIISARSASREERGKYRELQSQ